MSLAMSLIKSFLSTKKALVLLVFVALCFALQGYAVVYFHERNFSGDDALVHGRAPPPKSSMTSSLFASWEEEKAKSLQYVQQFNSNSTKRSLKFFHVPKAAGTAIEHVAGQQMDMPWGSCLFNHKPKRDVCTYPKDSIEWPRNYGWWHLPAQLFPMAQSNPYKGAELFAIIRDPFDRLVSEFYYICKLKVFDWRPDQCDRNRLFEEEYMNEWMQNKLAHKNYSLAETYLQDNGHFTPQYDFLVTKRGVRMVDYVLQMDDLSNQFSKLMGAFSLDIRMAAQKMNAARTSGAHLEPSHLDQRTVSSVQQVFAHDFELSPNYKKTPWEQQVA